MLSIWDYLRSLMYRTNNCILTGILTNELWLNYDDEIYFSSSLVAFLYYCFATRYFDSFKI